MKRMAVAALVMLAGCNDFYKFDGAPSANFPDVCNDQVYADPTVKRLIADSAGSSNFADQNVDRLHYAKLDAARRCMQQKGLIRGGGVERPRIDN